MNRILVSLFLLLILSSCGNTPRTFTFERMSDEEIYAYNEGLPLRSQVYCINEASVTSRIKRRNCKTYLEWTEYNTSAISTLNVLNAGMGISNTGADN